MDPLVLTTEDFWNHPAPLATGSFSGKPADLEGLDHHVLFQTSGSTGRPKWIALSKQALQASAISVNEHLQVSADSCWGLALPTHHVGGFGVAARAFAAHCRMACFSERWQARSFTNWVETMAVSHLSLVPTQVHDLVAAGSRAPKSLRAVVVGGGRLEVPVGVAARNLGWPVLASFGMTEAASQIATQPLSALDDIYQTSPIPVLPVWRVRLSQRDRLQIAGPALFTGTLSPAAEGWRFLKRRSEWYETGDRVLINDDGLTPLARADALVKVLGELVDPIEIEHELLGLMPGLKPGTFAVIPVPDERAGNALVPVFDAAVDPVGVKLAMSHYAEMAPGFRRLQPPIMLADFPRSALGKPLRNRCLAIVREMMRDGRS